MADKRYFICALLLGVILVWKNQQVDLSFSSIYCISDLTGSKMCKLKNVAYNPLTCSFELFLTEDSVINGINSYKDLQGLQLSSVRSHFNFLANVTVHLKEGDKKSHTVFDKVLAFVRFKPDNLMHIIHDDLIPLFLTLERICEGNWNFCLNNLNLMFLDDNLRSPYSYLYEAFSNNNFIYSTKLRGAQWFNELYLGLDLTSVWYQYGFNEPRGATNKTYINSHILYKFKKFILNQNKISLNISNDVILLRRMKTRKLINIDFISQSIKHNFKDFNFKMVDVDVNNSRQLLKIIVNAKLVVGMHGAELIFSLFMSNHSAVLELFPHGIPSSVVSFLKPIADLKLLNYYPWTNVNDNLTIRHPEYPSALGGLRNPSENQELHISSVQNINEIYCCTDPTFLHLMYQDTIVDSSFVATLTKIKFNTVHESNVNDWSFPDKVWINCKRINGKTQFFWEIPKNMSIPLFYSLYVVHDNEHSHFRTNETSWSIESSSKNVSVWISSIFTTNGHSSGDTFLKC